MIEQEIDWTSGLEIERIEGNLLYLKGIPYPHKGMPTIKNLEKANKLKRTILFPWVPAPILREKLLPFAEEFRPFSRKLAYIFEVDQAYRFRLQDLFAETTKEKLLKQPIKEILILLRIHKQRDYPELHRKFVLFFSLLILLFLFPPTRANILKKLKNTNYQNLLPDEGDKFWMKQKTDYEYAP